MKIPAAAQRALRLRALRWVRPCLWLGPLFAVLVLAIFAESRAQQGSGEEALVAAADAKLGDALRNADKTAMRKLLSLQFTFADENGKVFQRKEFLSDLKNVAASEAPSDVKVKVYGLVGMVTGSRKSAEGNPVFFLDVWAKQKGSWRALTVQDVVLGSDDSQIAAADPPVRTEAKALIASAAATPAGCKNPCETIPYRVRSPAEQDIVTTLQDIAKATISRNADELAKYIANDFVLYRTGRAPIAKTAALATIEDEKASNTSATVSEVEAMRLAVYGDGAAMIANYVSPDNSRPPYRAATIWVKRNGQWQLVISVQTDAKG
jgi:ketosteroid isomerase-like protein